MKALNLIVFCLLGLICITLEVRAQGVFFADNGTARTRMWTIDGPLAGKGIYGVMLAGTNPDSLSPVVPVRQHADGRIGWGTVEVAGVPPGESAFVQFVAWDSRLWGASLDQVPANQLGMTDIARVSLGDWRFGPAFAPVFTQPAIVPIPEPSNLILACLAAMLFSGPSFRIRRR